MRYYKGVLLGESITSDAVLSEVKIVRSFTKEELTATEEQPKIWTWYRIQVESEMVELVAQHLSEALKPRGWYTNLWREDDYWLIFPKKTFRSSSIEDSIWQKAVFYGLSLGIPISQLTPLSEVLKTQ